MGKRILAPLAALLTVFTINTHATDINDVYLGEAGYGGSGCPAGSASVTLSPDKKSLSLIFDEFSAVAGYDNGKSFDRKSCNVAIPVHVPNGYSVSIMKVDYRGYVYLPSSKYRARFAAEYFFAGQRGPRYVKTWRGSFDEDYMLSNTLGLTANIWSACGADVNLRVNTSMRVNAPSNANDVAEATVDSADFSAGLVYNLKWRRCNQ